MRNGKGIRSSPARPKSTNTPIRGENSFDERGEWEPLGSRIPYVRFGATYGILPKFIASSNTPAFRAVPSAKPKHQATRQFRVYPS